MPDKLTEPRDSAQPRFTAVGVSVKGRAQHGTTVDNVTDALREAVLEGVFPPSTWLREENLAAELRVSRTPVREALKRLSTEGLLIQVPNQGVQVTALTIEDVLAVYAVRENLEGLAARLSAGRAGPSLTEELSRINAEMSECAQEMNLALMCHLDLQFHRVIRDYTANSHLERFLTLIEHSIRRFGATTLGIPGRMEATVEEHERIITAIEENDVDAAEDAARLHMRCTRDARIQAFVQANT